MNYYLLSSKNCAVKLNGEYKGIANGNLSFLTKKTDEFLLQLFPNSPFKSICARIKNGKCLCKNVKIIDLYGDFLILPNFEKQQNFKFKILFDKQFFDGNLRVFTLLDKSAKLIIENQFGVTFETIDLTSENASVTANPHNTFLAVTVKEENFFYFYIFDVSEKPLLIYHEKPNFVSVTGENYLLKNASYLLNVAEIETNISLNPFKKSVKSIYKAKPFKLNKNLLPYAFLQEFQYGLTVRDYLSNDLIESEKYLKEFFGDFFAFAPISQNNENDFLNTKVILIGKTAKILTISSQNEKICDLNLI